MESLDDLYVFAVVVDSLGFSAAARRLGVTPSAVSRAVARLETRMGGALLSRSTRTLALTEFGRGVYEQCARIGEVARELEVLAEGHRGRPQGNLRVSAPVSFGLAWLVPRLCAFRERWPEVTVDLALTDQLASLRDGGCDVAVRISRRVAEGLVARKLLAFDFLLVASRDYLARAGTPARPEDLQSHPVLCLGQTGYGQQLTLYRGKSVVKFEARGGLRTSVSVALVRVTIEGAGIGVVPRWAAADALTAGQLVQVLPGWRLAGPYEDDVVRVVYAPTRHLAPKTRAFIDHLVAEAASERLPRGRASR